MRTGTLLAALLAGAMLGGCRASRLVDEPFSALETIPLSFPGGKKVLVEVADSPWSWEVGLMFRAELPRDRGMLFVFPDEGLRSFWMKNTLVDLDILFIGADKRITSVHHDVPHPRPGAVNGDIARREGTGRYVLELPAGAARRLGLKPGDLLRF